MSNRFILYQNGLPIGITSPVYPGMYEDNGIYGDTIAKAITETMLESDQYYLENSYLKADNTIGIRSVQPTLYHSWDTNTETWVITLQTINDAKNTKKAFIERKRVALSSAIISYDSKNLQADNEAITNINGKLEEIKAREALGLNFPTELLVWRDADNNIHTWTDVTSYKTWLQGLVIAIAERGTRLYGKSWVKKAEVDALPTNDINLILNYDIETGWTI